MNSQSSPLIDERLKEWATEKQAEFIDAMNKHHSQAKAAEACGVSRTFLRQSINALKARAAQSGYSPEHDMTRAVPMPFMVKGVSSYYDRDGNLRGQWVKSKLDAEKVHQAMREAVDALMVECPRVKSVPSPKDTLKDLCNLYTITDYHVGMRSWAPETGEDWDLDIAEKVLIEAFTHAVNNSPKSAIALVSQLGDFLHFDSLTAVTPQNANVLDADSRFGKVVRTATRLLRLVIDTALKRHAIVIVLMAEGNHDPASSVWLRHLFSLLYEKEPRVKVIDSETPFYAYQHGKTMLCFHHGHLVKMEQLPIIFAARFPQMWGTTTKRYCHMGHKHHVDEKEFAGMKVIQHTTLAAADAYSSRSGYQSTREITSITYHNKYGQVARTTVCPEMLT